MNELKEKQTKQNGKKNKIFEKGIGIAEKAKKQEGIAGVVM